MIGNGIMVPPPALRGRMRSAPLGLEEGQQCLRSYDGEICLGVIRLEPDDAKGGCSCHVSPPCSYCTSTMPECPGCGWREEE